MKFSVRRVVLIALNLSTTLLTLFTGLRENPLVVFATGKYDRVRARLHDGAINYDIIQRDLVRSNMLVDLPVVGDSYRFFTAPPRHFSNVGEDRSTCLRVNSINGSILNIYYNDFWGRAPRRTQLNLYSISPPNCDVVNFQPTWLKNHCYQRNGSVASDSDCHKYILNNFETLRKNRLIQTGVESDYGAIGVPFLRCQGRPEVVFKYKTDMMVHQNYWAGGNNFIMFHTSDCLALPLVRDVNWEYGLFKVQPMDDRALVLGAIDSAGFVTQFVNVFYAVISIGLILRGIFAAVTQTREVLYVPHTQRFLGSTRHLKYTLPFMPVLTTLATEDTAVLQFKGSVLMGSDVWMNHWLYILVSIVDSVVNVRLTYIIFQTGTWMLSKQVNFDNFLFLCSALTKMTWLMCLIHSLIRWLLKLIAYSMRSLKMVRPSIRDNLDWYADASALFLSYKVYSVLMFVLLYSFVLTNGNTTLMVRDVPPKRGVYGGDPQIAQFWNSELTCDFFVVLSIMTFVGYAGGSLILLTKYKHVPMNSVVRLLQKRYFFVGWDSMIAMEALGIDPMKPDAIVNDVAVTNCSVGSLLRQMYVSGPSGLVGLSGDYIFVDGGFSKAPVEFHFSIKKALTMGLCGSNTSKTSSVSKYTVTNASSDKRTQTKSKMDEFHLPSRGPVAKESKSLFERQLRVVTSGRYGRMLLIDTGEAGKIAKTADGTMNEFVVSDALSFMNILDIKALMGNGEKRLRIR